MGTHDMPEIDLSTRPRPINAAAKGIGTWISLLGAVLTSLAGYGILTQVQGNAISGLLGAIPGAVTLVTALLAAFGVVAIAEPQVTPLASPQDSLGRPLTTDPIGDQP